MIEINLLPEELRRREEPLFRLSELRVKRGVLIFLGVFVAAQALLSAGAFVAKGRFEAMKREIVTLREQNKEIEFHKAQTQTVRKRLREASALTARPFYWSALLNTLSDSVTKGIWLHDCQVVREKNQAFMRLEGSVYARGEETAYIGKFMQQLKTSPLFNDLFGSIELSNINQKRIKDFDVYDFVIRCVFKKNRI